MSKLKVSPIFVTTIYLIVGSIICPILLLVRLLLEGVSLAKWGGEFLWVLEALSFSWLVALSMAWTFSKLRYSSIGRVIGALLFGLLSVIIIIFLIMVLGYNFGGIVPSGVGANDGQRNILYLCGFFFVSTSALYASVYDRA